MWDDGSLSVPSAAPEHLHAGGEGTPLLRQGFRDIPSNQDTGGISGNFRAKYTAASGGRRGIVYYLRSSVAILNIRDFNPAAKIIAMFRNAVDMVHSFHSQLLYVSEENVGDFETAWRLQERRS